jgi:poly(beta-D-mannuronate) lyase
MQGVNYYTDAQNSIADPEKVKQFWAIAAPLRDYLNRLGGMTESIASGGRNLSGMRECAISWLEKWASADALRTNGAGGYELRLFGVISAATSLAKIVGMEQSCDPRVSKILAWLHGLIRNIVDDESSGRPPGRENNVTYWTAYGAFVIGLMTSEDDLKQWAIDVYTRALSDVTEDGFLPRELARGSLALNYHFFALTPLTLLRLLAENHGFQDVTRYDSELHLLTQRSIEAITAPSLMSEKASIELRLDKDLMDLAINQIFLETYACRFPEKQQALPLTQQPALRDWRLGSSFPFKKCPAGDLLPFNLSTCASQ